MKSSPSLPSSPTKDFTHSLRGRIRPKKDASESGSYTDSGYAKYSPLAGQSEEGSLDHGDNEKSQGKEVSDTE